MGILNKILKLTRLQARLPMVNADGTPTTAFMYLFNQTLDNIEASDRSQSEVLEQIATLLQLTGDTDSDLAAQARQIALVNSYTNPIAILTTSANPDYTTATIIVADHKRTYADAAATTVNVKGKTFANLQLNTTYYLYYEDIARKGGVVDIKYSTDPLKSAQGGNNHSLGSILTPSGYGAPTQTGGGVLPYGAGRYANQVQQ